MAASSLNKGLAARPRCSVIKLTKLQISHVLVVAIFIIVISTAPFLFSNFSDSKKGFNSHPKIKGKVNKSFYEEISKITGKLIVDSSGGNNHSSLKSAIHIQKNNMGIIVDRLCLSSCAEYLLPAAKTVVFENEPLIGFHGNPIMAEQIALQFRRDDFIKYCDDFYPASNMRTLYKMTNKNADFWKHELKALVLTEPEFVDNEFGCPILQWKFENEFWFPTSDQLREYLGIDFTGKVCADISDCYEKTLSFQFKKGTKLAVGDTVFRSKGRLWAIVNSFQKKN